MHPFLAPTLVRKLLLGPEQHPQQIQEAQEATISTGLAWRRRHTPTKFLSMQPNCRYFTKKTEDRTRDHVIRCYKPSCPYFLDLPSLPGKQCLPHEMWVTQSRPQRKALPANGHISSAEQKRPAFPSQAGDPQCGTL